MSDLSDWRGRTMLERVRNVSILAFNHSTLAYLGRFLHPALDDFSEPGGYQKDWHGLAELMGCFAYHDIQEIEERKDKVSALIQRWSTRPNATIGKFIQFLEQLERFDVLEDAIVQTRILQDVENYNQRQEELRQSSGIAPQPLQVPDVDSQMISSSGTDTTNEWCDEFKNITCREVSSGKPEYFDAFVCYTHDNLPFVKEMINQLEEIHHLKLCIPDRDIIPGCAKDTIVTFLIRQRCKKMIIVLSPQYLCSMECDFMTKFGHSLAPGARSKKLIPVLIRNPCSVPDILRYITLVDYTKCELVEWFWDRLAKALEESSNITLTEIFSPSDVARVNEGARALISPTYAASQQDNRMEVASGDTESSSLGYQGSSSSSIPTAQDQMDVPNTPSTSNSLYGSQESVSSEDGQSLTGKSGRKKGQKKNGRFKFF